MNKAFLKLILTGISIAVIGCSHKKSEVLPFTDAINMWEMNDKFIVRKENIIYVMGNNSQIYVKYELPFYIIDIKVIGKYLIVISRSDKGALWTKIDLCNSQKYNAIIDTELTLRILNDSSYVALNDCKIVYKTINQTNVKNIKIPCGFDFSEMFAYYDGISACFVYKNKKIALLRIIHNNEICIDSSFEPIKLPFDNGCTDHQWIYLLRFDPRKNKSAIYKYSIIKPKGFLNICTIPFQGILLSCNDKSAIIKKDKTNEIIRVTLY
jgi:hypothetical protein